MANPQGVTGACASARYAPEMGGLLLGVSLLLPGAELAWYAENDRHASWRKGETDSETIVGTVQHHLESLGYQVSWGIFSDAQTAAYLRFSSSG